MYHQGDIWLVNFDPSFGHEYQKIRPALIIENNHYLPVGNLLTVIPLSSQTDKAGLLDVLIAKNTANRLSSDSVVKTRQISTFDKRRFIKRVGYCDDEAMRSVMASLALYLEY